MTIFLKPILLMALLTLTATVPAAAANRLLVQDGDRVMFIGDDATLRFGYTRMVEAYFTLRYPDSKIRWFNLGWNDTALTRLSRWPRDVTELKPTVAVISFGMNDGGFAPLDREHRDNFERGLTGLIDALQRDRIQVILLTPNFVDPDSDATGRIHQTGWSYNETLAELARETTKLTERKRVPVADAFPLMLDVQTRAKRDNPKFTMLPDGIYPHPNGHAVSALALFKALGATEPAAALSIDAANRRTKTDRCRIDNLTISDQAITFARTDAALPAPLLPDTAPNARYLPQAVEFNQYRFQVTGLKAPRWKLVVEGIDAGTFSNTELAGGVNLAGRPGPWQALAKEVDGLMMKEQGQIAQRWVYLSQYVPPAEVKPAFEFCLKEVDAWLDTFQQQRLAAVKPRAWNWKLTAVER